MYCYGFCKWGRSPPENRVAKKGKPENLGEAVLAVYNSNATWIKSLARIENSPQGSQMRQCLHLWRLKNINAR